jgi:hypothetical protein
MQFFHRTRGYGHALIAEHRVTLDPLAATSSSYGQCGDSRRRIFDPMRRYEELYAEYLAFCD